MNALVLLVMLVFFVSNVGFCVGIFRAVSSDDVATVGRYFFSWFGYLVAFPDFLSVFR